jgi:hypothetical protein
VNFDFDKWLDAELKEVYLHTDYRNLVLLVKAQRKYLDCVRGAADKFRAGSEPEAIMTQLAQLAVEIDDLETALMKDEVRRK